MIFLIQINYFLGHNKDNLIPKRQDLYFINCSYHHILDFFIFHPPSQNYSIAVGSYLNCFNLEQYCQMKKRSDREGSKKMCTNFKSTKDLSYFLDFSVNNSHSLHSVIYVFSKSYFHLFLDFVFLSCSPQLQLSFL